MKRSDRVAEEVKHIVADILDNDIKDPELPVMTTVTDVEVSGDLAYATIYLSSINGSADESKVLGVMERAKGFIRRELGHELRLRQVPELRFKYDNSGEIRDEMSKLIDRVLEEDQRKAEERNG